ncbi:MAG: DUF2927 domain-containing protein [Pseudomonadota bacterium]
MKIFGLAAIICAILSGCSTPSGGVDWFDWTKMLLAQGHMRTDRGVTEAMPTAEELAVNFRRTAFAIEADPWSGPNRQSTTAPRILRRWRSPISYQVIPLGPDPEGFQRRVDTFMKRIGDLTGHPINSLPAIYEVPKDPKASVFVLYATDEALDRLTADGGPLTQNPNSELLELQQRIRARIADWRIRKSPCAFLFWSANEAAEEREPGEMLFGVALIRAEIPEPLLEACIEEELAQGMGLTADHQDLRPSIFNDDQEFALLTRQDALLLRVLYDPRLRPGMPVDDAMPIVRQIAQELLAES